MFSKGGKGAQDLQRRREGADPLVRAAEHLHRLGQAMEGKPAGQGATGSGLVKRGKKIGMVLGRRKKEYLLTFIRILIAYINVYESDLPGNRDCGWRILVADVAESVA
jgi:hypothetical protein